MHPFETQVDEVGTYRYDPATGRLELRKGDAVQGQGRAVVEGGRLTVTGDFAFVRGDFGGSKCSAVFLSRPMPHI